MLENATISSTSLTLSFVDSDKVNLDFDEFCSAFRDLSFILFGFINFKNKVRINNTAHAYISHRFQDSK